MLAIEKDGALFARTDRGCRWGLPGPLRRGDDRPTRWDVEMRLAHLTPPIKIVSNLPYNVGTERLIRWMTPAQWPPFLGTV